MGAAEALTQVALKQNKNNTAQLIQSSYNGVTASTVPFPGQSSLKKLYGLVLLSNSTLQDVTGPEGFLTVVPKFQFSSRLLEVRWSSVS